MGYKVITGDDFGSKWEQYLDQIYVLDTRNYKQEFWGEPENMKVRYRQNHRTFVCVVDDLDDKVVAYINFFPVSVPLWQDIVEDSMEILDDEIGNVEGRVDIVPYVKAKKELTPEEEEEKSLFAKKEAERRAWDEDYIPAAELTDEEDFYDDLPPEMLNRLFIISIVVDKDVRKDKSIRWMLSKGFIDYLNQLEDEGYHIDAISATAVSAGGKRFLRDHFFNMYREIEDGDVVCVLEGDPLEKMKSGELYKKSFKDDVFLFVPFAEHPKNPKIQALFDSPYNFADGVIPEDFEDIPEVEKILLNATNGCMEYECQNDVVKDMSNIYIGKYMFMHTLDSYPDLADPEDRPHILGEEAAYMSILTHRPSHMYVLMIFIPNSKYSPSMIEDQLSHRYIKIRRKDYDEETGEITQDIDENGFYQYQDLYEFIREQYGLINCGKGKSMLCMSGNPEIDGEMMNILSGEVYTSLYQSFHIKYDELKELSNNNRAIYDYYKAYMSEESIVFIPTDYDKENNLKKRIELLATYIFIVQLVMFQNTALNKMTVKVTNALAQEGDVSYQYIKQLYEDYAKTIKFWQSDSFMYMGTQQEALQIRNAFGNSELKEQYNEQQEFLERIIDLKNAQDDKVSNFFINAAATILAVLQVKDVCTAGLEKLYEPFDIEMVGNPAQSTFNILFICGTLTLFLLLFILRKRDRYNRVQKLREMINSASLDEEKKDE